MAPSLSCSVSIYLCAHFSLSLSRSLFRRPMMTQTHNKQQPVQQEKIDVWPILCLALERWQRRHRKETTLLGLQLQAFCLAGYWVALVTGTHTHTGLAKGERISSIVENHAPQFDRCCLQLRQRLQRLCAGELTAEQTSGSTAGSSAA